MVYPDLLVIFDQKIDSRSEVTDAKFICEVLSKSTESYDRGMKFESYQTLRSFSEYLLIDQQRMRAELYRKINKNHWDYSVYQAPSDVLELQSLDLKIRLEDIYEGVSFN